MYVCISLCLLLRPSNLGHLPQKLLKCDLPRATMSGDLAGARTGDLPAQRPRLYYYGSGSGSTQPVPNSAPESTRPGQMPAVRLTKDDTVWFPYMSEFVPHMLAIYEYYS